MTASAQMKELGWFFGRHWWWANRRHFLYPGLYYWNGSKNVRLIPLPRAK